jgi:hypothetical protein
MDDWVIVAVLFATVLLRLAMVLGVAYFLVPRGPACPHCDMDMLPVRHALLDRCLPGLQRRWCLSCGWNGVVRRGPAPAPTHSGVRSTR